MTTSKRTGRRALYVHFRDSKFRWMDHVVFSIGLDPTWAPGKCMLAFGSIWNRRWAFQVNNPVQLGEAVRHPHMLPVYRLFTRLQYGLDGRRYKARI